MLTPSRPSCFFTGDGLDPLHPDAFSSLEKAPAYAPVGAKHVLADSFVSLLDSFIDVPFSGNILFSSHKINK
ncbi:hypothetical protein NDU88_003347 [Pleurodeles waltl]|uniref:Uncharacterized protein n=1 Tax=Pleurodeles waltl TaxID=8319 RepID=A0AAV7KVB7_PLEWA|nr:hypothetical protein NDU88_003347 [Pleurodeles waltl]